MPGLVWSKDKSAHRSNRWPHTKKHDICVGAGVSVHCFENYAVLQRPLQPLLKALERLDWASFGLTVQAGFPPYLHEEDGSRRLLPADLIPSFVLFQSRSHC